MRMLVVRFRRLIRFQTRAALIAVGSVGLFLLLPWILPELRPYSTSPYGLFFGILAILIGSMFKTATKYERPVSTQGYADVLIPLVRSEREYCLVLRPFGSDGEIIVPRAEIKKQRIVGQTATLEQVVGEAAETTLHLATYAIVDQTRTLAPPGLSYLRASNDEWRMVVQRLIRRAHSIVLLMSGNPTTGDGFAWEVEQIVRYGMEDRVVIVLPPDDQGPGTRKEACRQAGVLLASLASSGRRDDLNPIQALAYEHTVARSELVVKYGSAGLQHWGVLHAEGWRSLRFRSRTSDYTYIGCLAEAFRATERELVGTGFRERYPLG